MTRMTTTRTTRLLTGGGVVVARMRRMGREDARLAIERSGAALAGWRDGTTVSHRSGLLSRWSSHVREHSEDIAMIMTRETRKPLHESRGEVAPRPFGRIPRGAGACVPPPLPPPLAAARPAGGSWP
jgi:acyl-CoA reductase-like NAD-dependent aldehyde dehydrogenase